jgi:allophanate hydrolase
MLDPLDLTIAQLRAAGVSGSVTPSQIVAAVLARDARVRDPAIWIVPPDEARLRGRAAMLEALRPEERAALPLFGVPFAAKDNIDVAGLPTTAGCPAYAYRPERSAEVVVRLLAAGAILVGKTNLDQFATGLNGTRSPYGIPRNPIDARFVPGGSSSGSAVAVAHGLVSFALGTDTAGSGRVPAGFCEVIGLKPSRGLLSCEGVVPACRSLDCLSIFARNSADARTVFAAAHGATSQDAFSRALQPRALPGWPGLRVGFPGTPEFFGDEAYAGLFESARQRARQLGAEIVTIDFAPFAEAAALLYGGAWVAERHAAVGAFIEAHPTEVNPTVRAIIGNAASLSASDAFRGLYQLEALRSRTRAVWDRIDVLLVPTAPTIPTLAELEADPIGPNSRLGTYTNFVNLLDLAAIAVPAGRRDDGLPFGVTLIAPAMTDLGLLDLAESWEGMIRLAVVGAHLEGQPLHHELEGAALVRRTRTAASYRLYALDGTQPPKPGLVRVADGGGSVELEVYALTPAQFGRFVARVPPPLAIGTVQLEGDEWVKGFVCEPAALSGGLEITSFGGWRAYRASACSR